MEYRSEKCEYYTKSENKMHMLPVILEMGSEEEENGENNKQTKPATLIMSPERLVRAFEVPSQCLKEMRTHKIIEMTVC